MTPWPITSLTPEEQGKPPSENQERQNLEWAEREADASPRRATVQSQPRASVAVQWSRSTAVVTGAK